MTEVAVVGSGFAGSLLARILHRQGHRVRLLERARHPRFALGESSTPLAAICLERLAARYGLKDLTWLAEYGRWERHLPALRHGLKRGFTFYSHTQGAPYRNGPGNERRLLVAASPADEVADGHWLRADLDAYMVERAAAEGVEYLDGVDLAGIERRGHGFRLTGTRVGNAARPGGRTRPLRLDVDFVVDASGAGGFLARHLPIPAGRLPVPLRTELLYSHFEGVVPFEKAAAAAGAELPPGPYPDERAAVHHLLEEGWMYVLRFDHGVASAGLVLEDGGDADGGDADGHDASEAAPGAERTARRGAGERELPPPEAWEAIVSRYPTLHDQFRGARPVRPIRRVPRLQRRLARAAGHGWALLPHAFCFVSPMFSTGIAWSVLAVERLALLLEPAAAGIGATGGAGVERYGQLLETEADHLARLLWGAYRLRREFDRFVDYSFLYFAAASFAEARQRLLDRDPREWAWDGFLGATDPVLRSAVDRVPSLAAWPGRAPPEAARAAGTAGALPTESPEREAFHEALRAAVAARDLAGLADPVRNRLYPADVEPLIAGARLLGLTPEQARGRVHRLRGYGDAAGVGR